MTWEILDAFVDEAGIRRGPPTLGQTTGGSHTGGSFHYRRQARDYGLNDSDANAISRLFAPIAKAHPDLIPEMFGADGVGFDNGAPYQSPGHTGHHTHVAIGSGVTLEQLRAAGGGLDLAGAVPIAASTSSTAGISEAGFRRFLLVVAGAGLVLWGTVLLGLDLGAVRGATRIGGRVAGKLVK